MSKIRTKRATNVEVSLRETRGDFERMLRRFIKKVKKSGILEEVRERAFYEKPSVKRRREKIRKKEVARKHEAARRKKNDIKYE